MNNSRVPKTFGRPEPGSRTAYLPALSVLTALFFIWGFITSLNDILVPHLKAVFTLNYTQAMLVQFCFFGAYFVMSIPSGYLVERIGYKNGIVLGLAIAGTGCLLFYPAAGWRMYSLFLTAFFVLASGITMLQVAANPYVTVLGTAETASGRLTLTQAFNSLGTTLGPLLGARVILAQLSQPAQLQSLDAEALASYQIHEAASVQLPYLGLAGVLLLLAVVFALARLPRIDPATHSDLALEYADLGSVWKYPQLLLGTLAIFTYVGGEVAIGSFLVSYLGEAAIGGLSAAEAGRSVAFYWGGAMLGRFIGAFLLRKIPDNIALTAAAFGAMSLLSVTMFSAGALAKWSVLAIGLCNSIMFPTIFSLALHGLGRHTGQGAGLLCTAIVGGAIVPLVQGLLADRVGIQLAFLVPWLCYLYIAYFGWRWHKPVADLSNMQPGTGVR